MKKHLNYEKKTFLKNEKSRAFFIALISLIISAIIYFSGGTKTAFAQFNFIPIIIASFYWGLKGGLVVALLVGLMAGPFMPLDVVNGIDQSFVNWGTRILIYSMVATTISYLLNKLNLVGEQSRENLMKDSFSGLYNANKLFEVLEEEIKHDTKFYLVVFEIENLNEINKYVNYGVIKDILTIVQGKILSKFDGGSVYSTANNELVFVLKNTNKYTIRQVLGNLIYNEFEAVTVGEYLFNLVSRVGVIYCDNNDGDVSTLFNKATLAINDEEMSKSGIYFYDETLEQENMLFHEIVSSFSNSLENNEFYTVLQPIIDINKNTVANAEVLLRWDRGQKDPIGPGVFVKVAEKTGFMLSLSKFVLNESVSYIENFKKNSIDSKISVNFTSNELTDENIYRWYNKIIKQTAIKSGQICFEITERVASMNLNKLERIMKNAIKNGFVFEIDDYGTGYNSLSVLLDLPFQTIKIDKHFIDLIETKDGRTIIDNTIQLVHKLGGIVIAEGIETKEQFMILKELECDQIQGFYFSKPLREKEFVEFYKTFNMNNYI